MPTMTSQAAKATTPRAGLWARKVRRSGNSMPVGRITPAVVHEPVTPQASLTNSANFFRA